MPGDLPCIGEILNHEILSGTSSWTEVPRTEAEMRAWFDTRRAARCPVLVAESEEGVVGYASYGPFRAGEGYRFTVEHSVYVAASVRRQGIASALLSALIAEAGRVGLSRMVGGVSADQPASLALHRRLGFEEQGRLRGVGVKHGRSLDLVFMVLALDGATEAAAR